MDVLADSGILLRLLEPTDPLHAAIDHAVRVLHARGDRIVIAPQNVAEFWNVCARPATARGGYGLSIAEEVIGGHPLQESSGAIHSKEGRGNA